MASATGIPSDANAALGVGEDEPLLGQEVTAAGAGAEQGKGAEVHSSDAVKFPEAQDQLRAVVQPVERQKEDQKSSQVLKSLTET